MEDYYLTPIESNVQVYYLVPIESSREVYFLKPIGETEQEEWIYYRTFGFSTNDMLDGTTHTWNNTPGDYTDSMASLIFPNNAMAVKIIPKSGAQCFNINTSQLFIR